MSHMKPPPVFIPTTRPDSAGGLLSPTSNPSSATGLTAPGLPLHSDGKPINQLLDGMRDTVQTLSKTFNSLQGHGEKMADLNTVDAAGQVHALRKQLVAQDKKQEARIEELKSIIRDVLVQEIASQLKIHLTEIIREKVAQRIREHVAAQLEKQFPEGLEEQLAAHRTQLNLVKLSLQNSESRRSNALLRENQLLEPLQPIMRHDGKPSPFLPPNLAGLLLLPGKSLRSLMDDYEIHFTEGDPPERHFNKVMQFLGIAFQMVPSPPSRSRTQIPLITSS